MTKKEIELRNFIYASMAALQEEIEKQGEDIENNPNFKKLKKELDKLVKEHPDLFSLDEKY